MIVESGDACFQEKTGSSPAAIRKYLASKGPVPNTLSREIKKLVESGTLLKVTFEPHPFLRTAFSPTNSYLAYYSDSMGDSTVVACAQTIDFDRC
jgi:hypothetical protein